MNRPDRLQPQHIEAALAGRAIGRHVVYYPRIGSTNRAARTLALQEQAHGWVVLADEQDAGRGRLERTWQSQPGRDILVSIIVQPGPAAAESFRLTMAASVAVVLAVQRVCGITCGIKWPNDIYLHGKKLCGILSEGQAEDGRLRFMIIGIGLNANSRMAGRGELEAGAISLMDATKRLQDRTALLIALLKEFNRLYAIVDDSAGETVRQLWERHAMMLGRLVAIHNGDAVLRGTARAIMPDGRLIVRDRQGLDHKIACGDLSLRLE